MWWELLSSKSAGADSAAAISNYVLPWLDRLRSVKAILDTYEGGAVAPLGYPTAEQMADTALLAGDRPRAERIIRNYVASELMLEELRRLHDRFLVPRGLEASLGDAERAELTAQTLPRGTVVEILPESGITPVAQLGVIHSGTDRSGYEIDLIGEEGWGARLVDVKRAALRLQRPNP